MDLRVKKIKVISRVIDYYSLSDRWVVQKRVLFFFWADVMTFDWEEGATSYMKCLINLDN